MPSLIVLEDQRRKIQASIDKLDQQIAEQRAWEETRDLHPGDCLLITPQFCHWMIDHQGELGARLAEIGTWIAGEYLIFAERVDDKRVKVVAVNSATPYLPLEVVLALRAAWVGRPRNMPEEEHPILEEISGYFRAGKTNFSSKKPNSPGFFEFVEDSL